MWGLVARKIGQLDKLCESNSEPLTKITSRIEQALRMRQLKKNDSINQDIISHLVISPVSVQSPSINYESFRLMDHVPIDHWMSVSTTLCVLVASKLRAMDAIKYVINTCPWNLGNSGLRLRKNKHRHVVWNMSMKAPDAKLSTRVLELTSRNVSMVPIFKSSAVEQKPELRRMMPPSHETKA